MYSIDEIVAATEKLFGYEYSPALVEAALKLSGLKSFTAEQAKKIVKETAEKKVKK